MAQTLDLNALVPNCDPEFSKWLAWGLADEPCPKCAGTLMLLARSPSSDSMVDLAAMCTKDGSAILCWNLPLDTQSGLQDRLRRVRDVSSLESAAARLADVLLTSRQEAQLPEVPVAQRPLEPDRAGGISETETTLPEGYRSVSWIRDYEAQVILSAYRSKQSQEFVNDAGSVIFRARFHAADSTEALKYRAGVEATRVRSTGAKVIGWIRCEEAQAVVDATRERRDIEFEHRDYGKGGLVQYFPPDSAAAMKYRSSTRLLRMSRL
jgi:hypothetical protein